MNLKLNAGERVTLSNLLPKQENYLNYKLIHTLISDLSFSEKEHKDIGIQVLPDNRIGWTNGKITKDIYIPEVIEVMIVEKLKSLEKEKNINGENISLYEMFVVNKKKTK